MPASFLVVRFSSLGDVLLSSAPVVNLRIAYPDSCITYLTKARYRPVVQLFDGVDEIVTLPDEAGATAYLRLLNQLGQKQFTGIIDLHGNARAWLARKLISADQLAVYNRRRSERRH